jgi:DnaJ-class molecular chaperone
MAGREEKRKECPVCGGTGQVGFFQGVSRFLLTWEECPECCGTGQLDPGKGGRDNGAGSGTARNSRRKK